MESFLFPVINVTSSFVPGNLISDEMIEFRKSLDTVFCWESSTFFVRTGSFFRIYWLNQPTNFFNEEPHCRSSRKLPLVESNEDTWETMTRAGWIHGFAQNYTMKTKEWASRLPVSLNIFQMNSVAPSPQHSRSVILFVFSMDILRGCIFSCPSEG